MLCSGTLTRAYSPPASFLMFRHQNSLSALHTSKENDFVFVNFFRLCVTSFKCLQLLLKCFSLCANFCKIFLCSQLRSVRIIQPFFYQPCLKLSLNSLNGIALAQPINHILPILSLTFCVSFVNSVSLYRNINLSTYLENNLS